MERSTCAARLPVLRGLVVTPISPGDPVVLAGDVRDLWLRLAHAPVPDRSLSDAQLDLVREFEAYGIASADEAPPTGDGSVTGRGSPPPFTNSCTR